MVSHAEGVGPNRRDDTGLVPALTMTFAKALEKRIEMIMSTRQQEPINGSGREHKS
jgi:hypothetical protein